MDIKNIIQELKGEQTIDWNKNFVEQELFDSLEIMILVEKLEEEFNCTISGTEIVPENFETIALIEELIRRSGGVV